MIIDRYMVRVRAELGLPETWEHWPGSHSAGLVHRYCEHLLDRPLTPIATGRVFLAMQWRLGVTAWDLEDAIWAWENRAAGAEPHRPASTTGTDDAVSPRR